MTQITVNSKHRPNHLEIFAFQKYLLDKGGVNHTKSKNLQQHFGLMLIYLTLAGSLVSLVGEMVEESEKIEKVFNALCLFIQMLNYSVKLFNYRNNRKILNELIEIFESPLLSTYSEKYDDMVNEQIKNFRMIDWVYRGSTYLLFIYVFFYPLWVNNPQQPSFFPGYFFMDAWDYQIYCLLLQVFIYLVSSCCNVSIDLIFAGLMSTAALHFDILGDELSNLAEQDGNFRVDYSGKQVAHSGTHVDFKGKFKRDNAREIGKPRMNINESERELGELQEDEEIERKIQLYVVKHLKLMEFVKRLGCMMPYGIFTQFFVSIVVICLSGIEIFIASETSLKRAMISVNFLVCMLLEIFMFCWFGNELIIKSSDIGSACYMSKWYCQSLKVRKMLFIVMERAKKPISITAANFVIVSLPTLAMILSKAYSYFALLQSVFSNKLKH